MCDETTVDLPFQRVPMCACDPGSGPEITRQQMMECRFRGGPCAPDYCERNPDSAKPAALGE